MLLRRGNIIIEVIHKNVQTQKSMQIEITSRTRELSIISIVRVSKELYLIGTTISTGSDNLICYQYFSSKVVSLLIKFEQS